MACIPTGPFDGGTWNQPLIVDPTIQGGSATNQVLSNVTLTDNITIDDTTARLLTEQMCQHILKCVEDFGISDARIAKVFVDCEGEEHIPGAAIPTCAQMEKAINEAGHPQITDDRPPVTHGTDAPTTIVGASRAVVLGKPDTYFRIGDMLIPAYRAKE